MPRLLAVIALLLLLVHGTATAHIAGVTDTGITISRNSVELVYTVPKDNLNDLVLDPTLDPASAIQRVISNGFVLHNDQRRCINHLVSTRSLESIGSEQYTYRVDCNGPAALLNIQYDLFFDIESKHENFTRITLLNHSQNVTFSNNNREHVIPVKELLLRMIERRQGNAPTEKPAATHYFPVGMEHIAFGFDHLLFLLTIILLPVSIGRLLALVTTFTLAHSITLGLSVFDIVRLPPAMVESAIAFSIVYVAVENIFHLQRYGTAQAGSGIWTRRLITTFVFGLIHGFGFSYILNEMGLGEQLISSLLFFNLGVEAGQLLAVLLVYPVLYWLFKRYPQSRWAQIACAIVGLIGLYWLLERLAQFI